MKGKFLLVSAIVGLLTSFIFMAVAYLGNALLNLAFIPFDVFDWLARHLPGAVIDAVINSMVSVIDSLQLGPTSTVAKLAEQIQALGFIALIGVVFGLAVALVGIGRLRWIHRAGTWGGVILWAAIMVVEFTLPQGSGIALSNLIWILILTLGWGWLIARMDTLYIDTVTTSGPPAPEGQAQANWTITRRNFFALAGSSLVSLVVLALGFRNLNQQPATTSVPVTGGATPTPPVPRFPYGPQYTSGPAASPSPAALAKRIAPAPGTRTEITPVDEFYRIDINALPPVVEASTWNLTIKGLVQKPLTLSLADILARPSITQALTLSCISNPVGGDLISTNYWTGVPFKNVLADAGVLPSAKGIEITAVDGFFEYVPLDEAMDERTLLVYAMNGEALTAAHGFPLRIFIPNHYGMKQPKWIQQMVVTDTASAGYWVERGWSERAIPQTTSVIDTRTANKESIDQNGVMPLGGIAWSGERGISKVEIQIDGQDWITAELRDPAVSPLTWVQWRYNWKTTPGGHTIRVRATDGEGHLQTSAVSRPGPYGATGLDQAYISI